MKNSLSAFVPENLVSRDGFDSPVPRQLANIHTQAESGVTYGIPPEFHGGVHSFTYHRHIPSGQSRVYRVTQLRTNGVHCLPRVRRHGTSKPKGSSERVLPWQVTMDQFIFAPLSHAHYWYEVGMLKVPAVTEALFYSE